MEVLCRRRRTVSWVVWRRAVVLRHVGSMRNRESWRVAARGREERRLCIIRGDGRRTMQCVLSRPSQRRSVHVKAVVGDRQLRLLCEVAILPLSDVRQLFAVGCLRSQPSQWVWRVDCVARRQPMGAGRRRLRNSDYDGPCRANFSNGPVDRRTPAPRLTSTTGPRPIRQPATDIKATATALWLGQDGT